MALTYLAHQRVSRKERYMIQLHAIPVELRQVAREYDLAIATQQGFCALRLNEPRAHQITNDEHARARLAVQQQLHDAAVALREHPLAKGNCYLPASMWSW